MVKVLSWNINGLGKVEKRCWVQKMVKENNLSFLCLQETKMSAMRIGDVYSLWGGGKQVEFVALDAVGYSGGILSAWNTNLFVASKTDKQEGLVAVLGVWINNNISLGVINVYVPQNLRRKKTLWTKILDVMRWDLEATWIKKSRFNSRSWPISKIKNIEERGSRMLIGDKLYKGAGLPQI